MFDSAHALWGYFRISVDESHSNVEIIPERISSGHWNVLTWLENGPCTSCFKLTKVSPSGNGTLLVDIEIIHPFGK
ncbi:MAG TPA: hypothetical protein VGB30_03935 [bacterium]|jgi:hypothetical protein